MSTKAHTDLNVGKNRFIQIVEIGFVWGKWVFYPQKIGFFQNTRKLVYLC